MNISNILLVGLSSLLISTTSCAKAIAPKDKIAKEVEQLDESKHLSKDTIQAAPPIMGWSSWNTYRIHINDDLIHKQAKAMVDLGLKAVGYRYINIDDGFFGYRDKTGMMHTHPQRFPHGLKGIAEYIHSLGLKAGIYSDAGRNTCGSIWDKDRNGIGSGLYGHERQDAELYFNKWNFDFIKIDYCGAGQELNLNEEKRYGEICTILREVAHHPISINICRWAFPGTWAEKYANSWRISTDIQPQWQSIKYIIKKNLYLSAFARNGHFNDMDMLEISRGLSDREEETHFGMWCMMSSPLLIGCDMTSIKPFSLQLLKNKDLIALDQDPLYLQAYVVRYDGKCYVLTKDLETKNGTTRAVAIYNPTDQEMTQTVTPELLDLTAPLQCRDLIAQADMGSINVINTSVPAHGVRIYKIIGARRTDRVIYEAETAYMPCYQDLQVTKKDITFQANPYASGMMTVKYLGGREENYAEWHASVSKAGKYEMTISYVPTPLTDMQVTINDKVYTLSNLIDTSDNKGQKIKEVSIIVNLQKENTIRIGSPYSWLPPLDRFTLRLVK